MPIMECRTVFIDLDDTLWNFRANTLVALRAVYEELDLKPLLGEYESFQSRYLKRNHELWDLYHRGEITKELLMVERFRTLFRQSGCPDPDDRLSVRLNERYLDLLSRQSVLVDGAREALEYLKSRGYRLYILSNGFEEAQFKKLRSSGIEHYFERVVLSDEIGVTKPDRRLFDYALSVTGSAAEDTVLIGDNYEVDVQGALAAGWHALFFDRDRLPELPAGAYRPDGTLTDWREISNWL